MTPATPPSKFCCPVTRSPSRTAKSTSFSRFRWHTAADSADARKGRLPFVSSGSPRTPAFPAGSSSVARRHAASEPRLQHPRGSPCGPSCVVPSPGEWRSPPFAKSGPERESAGVSGILVGLCRARTSSWCGTPSSYSTPARRRFPASGLRTRRFWPGLPASPNAARSRGATSSSVSSTASSGAESRVPRSLHEGSRKPATRCLSGLSGAPLERRAKSRRPRRGWRSTRSAERKSAPGILR